MFKRILFDFDGTLMDTSRGVFNSFDRVVEHYKLNIPRSVYPLMIGPPLKESFTKILKLPESEIVPAMAVYRDYYARAGMFEADVYDGVVPLIKALRDAGLRTFVATSKPEVYANEILKRKGMLELFDFVGGADLEEKIRVEKCDIIQYVLETDGNTNKDDCLLIGDRLYDVEGAHAAGIRAAGILWGFGTREEFERCGADYILETPEDVKAFLLDGALEG